MTTATRVGPLSMARMIREAFNEINLLVPLDGSAVIRNVEAFGVEPESLPALGVVEPEICQIVDVLGVSAARSAARYRRIAASVSGVSSRSAFA